MIEQQFDALVALRMEQRAPTPTRTRLPNGGYLIVVPEVGLGQGWNRRTANVLFVAPPGYPAARPDCFWVEPAGLRLAGGGTPANSNDANPIPGDIEPARRTTWFSWHVQSWNPNTDKLVTYFNVILQRLKPAR